MVRTGFRCGDFVEFNSHDRGTVLGLVLGQNFAHDFDGDRTYFLLYRDAQGREVHDSFVAEGWMKAFEGYVPQEDFELTTFVRKLVEEATPEVELPNED